MARQQKTNPTAASVDEFLDAITDDSRRADARALTELMREATGVDPVMWGPSIVGYGASVNDAGAVWMRLGFSPRSDSNSIYLLSKPADFDERLERIGTTKRAKSCFYVKRMGDIDPEAFRDLVAACWAESRATMPDPAAT